MSAIRELSGSGMPSFDSDGNGKVDVDELLAQFDSDHDGNLGKDELQHFAEQLSNQLEFNNTLLQQLHSMEESQLNLQKELQNKQDSLQRALKASDDAKAEVNEAKRKLKIAQEVSDNMTKQSRDMRAETTSLRQELENVSKISRLHYKYSINKETSDDFINSLYHKAI
jgi:chromosome segregation ATPase